MPALEVNGRRYGCGVACTVHLDGAPRRACSTPLGAALGKRVAARAHARATFAPNASNVKFQLTGQRVRRVPFKRPKPAKKTA